MTKKTIIILGIVLVAVVLVALYSFGLIPWFTGSTYQAVFLSNGQVYFGKLFNESGQYPILREVYYLQITQAPQPIQPGEQPPTNINIVKLGGELHAPKDEMRINRDHIVFVEDLKNDSQVIQAINQFKEANK